jgi:hypothetical protein
MKKRRLIVLGALLAAGFFAVIISLAAASDATTAFLPGITVKDEHPNGCVDCHKNAGEKQDYRLNVALAQIKGHPNIAKIVKKVPNDCTMCHKAGGSGKAPALANVLHESHYKDAAKSAFITVYQGACLNCHQLNTDTGDMKVKSGPANW